MLKPGLLVFIIMLLVSGQCICPKSASPQESQEDVLKSSFVFGAGEVGTPQGVFLLIRKGQQVGAIRFTNIEPDATLGTGKATYESYFQGDGSKSFLTATVVRRSGEINVRPIKGVKAFPLSWSQRKVQIGKWSFACNDPGYMTMRTYYGSEKDYGYEFAATSARQLDEIDASDTRLRWFRYDPNTRVRLPLSDLPKKTTSK